MFFNIHRLHDDTILITNYFGKIRIHLNTLKMKVKVSNFPVFLKKAVHQTISMFFPLKDNSTIRKKILGTRYFVVYSFYEYAKKV